MGYAKDLDRLVRRHKRWHAPTGLPPGADLVTLRKEEWVCVESLERFRQELDTSFLQGLQDGLNKGDAHLAFFCLVRLNQLIAVGHR